MNGKPPILFILGICIFVCMNSFGQNIRYVMPEESSLHEGTWLQWPHQYTYGLTYRNRLDQTWVDMTKSISASEKVHIIAYNNSEQNRIISLLNTAGVSLTNVDFYLHPTDDVWVRDNGPVFVYDTLNNIKILDWGFNGWGNDAPYSLDDIVPQNVSSDIGIIRLDLSAMVLEGGAIEHDGHGTMVATKSSVTHISRNPGLTQAQIEDYLTIYMGITKFIWLDGLYGTEITDMHIDGFARFANDSTIVTMNNTDLAYWEVPPADISTLYNASDMNNRAYRLVYVPLTQNDVTTLYGNDLGYKGSYVNYYIANTVILVPNYNDPNDTVANNIIQNIYPGKTVTGIDIRNLYENGGMVHCVTQQQPVSHGSVNINRISDIRAELFQNTPNPFSDHTTITFTLKVNAAVSLVVYNIFGQKMSTLVKGEMDKGTHSFTLSSTTFESGIYTCVLTLNNTILISKKISVIK